MKKRVFQVLLIIVVCSIPLIFMCSCGGSNNFKCVWCGDAENRALIYASGSNELGIKYKSCVGISGCIGVGCGTKLMPVECMEFEISSSAFESTSGYIVYYEDGCVDGENVKYHAVVRNDNNCSCTQSTTEIDDYGDQITIKNKDSCLGCVTNESEVTYTKDETIFGDIYDIIMPERQFPIGCWSCGGNDE